MRQLQWDARARSVVVSVFCVWLNRLGRCVIIGSVFSIDGQGTRILGDFLAVFSLDTSLGFAAKRGDTIEVF